MGRECTVRISLLLRARSTRVPKLNFRLQNPCTHCATQLLLTCFSDFIRCKGHAQGSWGSTVQLACNTLCYTFGGATWGWSLAWLVYLRELCMSGLLPVRLLKVPKHVFECGGPMGP